LEAAILHERGIIGRLSREELEDRLVYSVRGCPSTGESDHWQALQGRAGGQVSIQPQRLPFYRREPSLAGSLGKSWRTGKFTASEAALLQERAIIERLSREELEDRSVYSLRGCPSTGESNHWQALQGRAGGQVSMQPQRLLCFIRALLVAGFRDE
jgi:hypothetical protein